MPQVEINSGQRPNTLGAQAFQANWTSQPVFTNWFSLYKQANKASGLTSVHRPIIKFSVLQSYYNLHIQSAHTQGTTIWYTAHPWFTKVAIMSIRPFSLAFPKQSQLYTLDKSPVSRRPGYHILCSQNILTTHSWHKADCLITMVHVEFSQFS